MKMPAMSKSSGSSTQSRMTSSSLVQGLGQVALGDDAVEDLELLGADSLGLFGLLALGDVLDRAFEEDLAVLVADQLGVFADMDHGAVPFSPDRLQPLDLAVALQALDEIAALQIPALAYSLFRFRVASSAKESYPSILIRAGLASTMRPSGVVR